MGIRAALLILFFLGCGQSKTFERQKEMENLLDRVVLIEISVTSNSPPSEVGCWPDRDYRHILIFNEVSSNIYTTWLEARTDKAYVCFDGNGGMLGVIIWDAEKNCKVVNQSQFSEIEMSCRRLK